MAMIAAPPSVPDPSLTPITERFDPIACLSSRDRERAGTVSPGVSGRYIQVQSLATALLIPLGDDPLHIGRGVSVDLRLDDSSVSRRHAIVVPREAGAQILDDRSLNGTFVNGRRIEQDDLRNGDIVTIGRFDLRYVEI